MSLPHYHPGFQAPRDIEPKENPLSVTWHDSAWIPILNPGNVMDYFTERSNPFYDRTCNNEIIKMQRLSSDQLQNMTGLEYILLHVQEPILYVIRKQHRHSISQVTPLADYYILAGIVYQAPDMSSVVNSRLLTTLHHLQNAFEEAISFSRYHPSKGYWWEFKDNESQEKPKTKDKAKEEPSSHFQRRRVDVLLGELFKKFPYKMPSPPQLEKQTSNEDVPNKVAEPALKVEIKQEPQTNSAGATSNSNTSVNNAATENQSRNTMKPPPEKRQRVMP